MNKTFFIAALFLSCSAFAQTYDLVRTITNVSGNTEDSVGGSFTQTGTMEIIGSKLVRKFNLCAHGGACTNLSYTDEIIGASETSALIAGDSGDFVPVSILSLSPTIIIMTSSGITFEINEYKPR